MSGATRLLVAMGAGLLHSDTLTIGNTGNTYGFSSGVIGSLGDATYTDRGSNARTIIEISYNTSSGLFFFTLDGTDVPNADATFQSLVVNGVYIPRGALTYDNDDGAGHSTWSYTPGSNIIGTSGSIPYRING